MRNFYTTYPSYIIFTITPCKQPRLPSWANDLIKTDESIIAGIESAGKKYDDGDNGNNEATKKEEKKEMVKSTGFDFPALEKNKKSSQEEEDDEEFSFRPAYSRQGSILLSGISNSFSHHHYYSLRVIIITCI